MKFILLLGCIANLSIANPVHAEQLPQWELGFALGALYGPDYRGANESRGYVVPLPYFIYRSNALNVDKNGVRGQLYGFGRSTLVISAAGGIPVRSSQNQTRAGMPNLDPTIEVGPSLETRLWRNTSGAVLTFNLPLRAAIASNLAHAKAIGWVFAPQLNLAITNMSKLGDIDINVGPLYTSRRYNEYYYGVATDFATTDRPAYQAHGGYSGSHITLGLSKKVGNAWVGAFVRYDDLTGATFADSPLVKTRHSLIVGTGIAYVLTKSKTLVSVP